jgi:hypothetical protein
MNQQLQTVETEVVGQRALFDYGALDQETQVLVRLRAGEIKSLAKRVAADIVEIGGKLAEVKDRVGGNGKFNDWLSAELGWSERTAYNFISVWQRFGAANFALENVATSALYLLAAPSTPAEAVEAARQIAESGEEVTHGVAKEIVRQAKARKPKQADLIEEPARNEEEPEESDSDFRPGFPSGFDPKRAERGLAQTGPVEAVDPSATCLCACKAGDHTREDGEYAECTKCECEVFQRATEAEIAERDAAEKALGIGQGAALVEKRQPAPVSAQKPAAVEASPKRPAAWFKQRVEINITLMPGSDDASRKVMHTVRVGDGADDIPFVAITTGEDDTVNNLPYETFRLLNKAAEAFAKKPAAKPAAKPAKKPTVKSKPAAKKPAAKTKAKGGKK